ncbi:hypothetical protein C8J55DRAFT_516079 [Lentinula edodes]|uniref:Zinc-finger domain-containing protein n=1 Tax=Lentinula lateritia TaxID=40482 RepID=A0A9W9A9I5_9AGAR|nr:hypothetical protein C8J55DRAFT_516079 [Lentinula edodes]
MSTTPSSSTPVSSVRRFKQVYVEIPPSPLHTSRRLSIPSVPSRLFSSNVNHHKGNTSVQHSISKHAAIPSRKRKDGSSSLQLPIKKPRIEHMKEVGRGVETELLIRCHDCRAKRHPLEIIQCTSLYQISYKLPVTRHCKTNYCRNCLKNKYNEDLDRVSFAASAHKENGETGNAYMFKCPKCRGHCNCWKCRHKAAPKSTPAFPQANVPPELARATVNDLGTATASKGKAHKAKLAPSVTWSPLPTQLKVEDAEDRIFIREFILRFSGIPGMALTKNQLEELEFIAGTHDLGDDDDDENVYVDWVSETCVKSLVISLIGVLAAEEDSSATLVMKKAMQDVRNSGANLTKIWTALSSLRAALGRPEEVSVGKLQAEEPSDDDDESSEDRIILEYPDPLPAPANHEHNVRSTRFAAADISLVVHSAQMIPVILGLIDAVMECHAIRVELDSGTKEGRERFRESRELIKLENVSWKSLEESREPDATPSEITAQRHTHKSKVQDIENAAKVLSSAFSPRFSPLGSDPEGRVYWALTPGVSDREYALDYIVSRLPNAPKSKRPRNRKQRQQREEEDSQALREWSWFIAVWGKKPHGNGVNEGGDEPQWWGFWNPQEIRNLAEWLSITNGLKSDPSDGNSTRSCNDLKILVKRLTEYATSLEWRNQGEER